MCGQKAKRRTAGLGLVGGRIRVFRIYSQMHRSDLLPDGSAGAEVSDLQLRQAADRISQVQGRGNRHLHLPKSKSDFIILKF
jgi:hypothetical protein